MENRDQQLYDKFDRLISQHRALIDRLCMQRALGDKNRCAELRQDCYISIWHYLPKLRDGSNHFHEAAWVAWHCRSVFSHLNYRRRTHLFLPLDNNMADTISESDESELRDAIDALAIQLTPHERRAFYLMADDYSAEDMAKELGIKYRSAILLRHRIIKNYEKTMKIRRNDNHEETPTQHTETKPYYP